MNASSRRYLATHQWLEPEGPDVWRLGITDFAQRELGDIVFVDLPEEGVSFEAGETLFAIESVKTASEVAAPCALEVLAVNTELRDAPERLNDAAEQTWVVLFRATGPFVVERLDAEAYQALTQ